MKIKISDLVNKVINREEMPKEVLFNGNIYKWCNNIGDYRKDGWDSCLMIRDIFDNFDRYGSFYNMLFEDVEIIEEPKKIEKIKSNGDEFYCDYTDTWISKDKTDAYCEYLMNKTNELIDEINNLKEND
jgi:hypothetical protein|nr:MAG TPA: hypothetical protein [Caudoviricetes sp.]